MSRDGEAAREALVRDARTAREALNRAREELRQARTLATYPPFAPGVPVTPEEEHAWIELERRCGSAS